MRPGVPEFPVAVTDVRAVQRRTLRTLAVAQVFSSLGNGSTLALGSVLAVQFSGNEAWAGVATTMLGLGAAVSAVPLARVALARGRRIALAAGLGVAVLGTAFMVAAVLTASFPLLVLGCLCVGVATAANLQARFAAADLSEPQHRGRDLSFVVWAITVGAVVGPNLVAPGAALSRLLDLPADAGPFLISAAGMVIGGATVLVSLRPDPLLTRRALDGHVTADRAATSWSAGARIVASHPVSLGAVIGMVGAHATMVGVMSMTPLHLTHRLHGAPHGDVLTVIGITLSLHIAGMYALSPVVGVVSDRIGARRVLLGGLSLTVAAVIVAGVGARLVPLVTVGLVLLGLGWSAATVAGATLLTASLPAEQRVTAQGFNDALTSLTGALAAASAGLVMGGFDYLGVGAAYGCVAVAALAGALVTTRQGHGEEYQADPVAIR